MVGSIPKLPGKAWASVVFCTITVTLASAAVSVAAAITLMIVFIGEIDVFLTAIALILPLIVTPPIVLILTIRHQQLKLANDELRELAYKDSMLGCMNRRGFTAALDIALQYASPHRACALLIIDADNFKRVNDQFGHDQGDLALQVIADAIKSAIRASDILGRIGGEEFGAFLPGTDEESAREIAHRICMAVSTANFAPDGLQHALSVSVGGAIATEATQFATLYRAADQRLYAAKNSGRNRAHFSMANGKDCSGAAA